MSTTITYKNNQLTSFESGTKTLKTAGKYLEDDIAIVTDPISLQAKTVTPTESQQTVNADSGYTGLGTVNVEAISSTYVGSGITSRSSTDLTISGATVTAPAGYYSSDTSASIANGALDDPTVIYNNIGTWIGYITVRNEIKTSGYLNSSSTKLKLFNLSEVLPIQAAKTISPTESTQTAVDQYKWTTGAITVDAIPSTYVGSDITRRDDTDLSISGATVTVPAGYYESQETKSVAIGSATTPATTITVNPTINVSNTGLITTSASASQSVTPTISEGYITNGTAGTVSINGSNTLQLTTQAATTITPSSSQQTAVAAGKYTTGAVIVDPIPSSYVQPTSTKGATTYNTSTTDQTIVSGTYLTGAQTIKAVKVTGLAASNVASGVTVKVGDANDDDRITSVTGTFTSDANATAADIVSGKSGYVNGVKVNGSLVIVNYYTGSSAPSNSLGSNGDIYLQTSN